MTYAAWCCVIVGGSIEGASSAPSSVLSVETAAQHVKSAADTATRTASASSTVRLRATWTCPTRQPASKVIAGAVTVSASSAWVVPSALTAYDVDITGSTRPPCLHMADQTCSPAITSITTTRSSSLSLTLYTLINKSSQILHNSAKAKL